ncbi:MAG: hypothetical protein HY746_05300 [Elusimicrobia bacterium]|nr:hypothetical protein [Elusimicrobiota bacterium]
MKLQSRKSKAAQYIAGGVVAVIILFAWVSLPLMHKTSLDASVPYGNSFKTSNMNLNSLSDFPYEAGAPGSPLSGEMINNPSTSGEEMGTLLYSGMGGISMEETAEGSKEVDLKFEAGSSKAGPPASGSDVSGAKGKFSPTPSLAGGGGATGTSGQKNFSQFFGSGGQKADMVQPTPDLKNLKDEKKGDLMAMLQGMEAKSKNAAESKSPDASRAGASSAFETAKKAPESELNSGLENAANSAGMELGKAAGDLKKSDPSMNKKKINLPEPEEKEEEDNDEMYKKMIMQMIIQATLGSIFGAIGQSIALSINPDYKTGQ